jgi:hypothetical protein
LPTVTLTDVMAAEPLWIRIWLATLVATHFAALFFVVYREAGRWRVRSEPLAILASFLAAAILMNALYARFGYVRLLGLAHLVFWPAAYAWVLRRRRAIGASTGFGIYAHLYLVIAGICLVLDVIDLVRYWAGDTAPLRG